MNPRRFFLQFSALAAAAGWPWARGQGTAVATVAAASDMKLALEEMAKSFEADTGHRLRLVFGASGQLYTQILQGAPFHVFLSADEDLVLRLAEAGRTRDRGRVYARGRLALLVPKGGVVRADPQLDGLAQALRDGQVQRLAIANPMHAPYGQRAQEVLQHRGLWAALQGKLVLGENVSQATQFALSGATQGGVVASALAQAPASRALGDFAVLPEVGHRPLWQRMVLLPQAPAAAQAFYDHLSSPLAHAVLQRHGFALP